MLSKLREQDPEMSLSWDHIRPNFQVVDLAYEAKKLGMKIIAVTSMEYATTVTALIPAV